MQYSRSPGASGDGGIGTGAPSHHHDATIVAAAKVNKLTALCIRETIPSRV